MAKNYSIVTLDSVEPLLANIYGKIPLNGDSAAKTFVGDQLNATGFEVSYGVVAAGGASPFVHAHQQNEELYVIISGAGEMRLDDDSVPIKAGSFIRCAPPAKRLIKNTSEQPMIYLCVQAKAGSLDQKTAKDAIIY
jgi:uncharacterized cupin superfamily protein